MEFGFQASMNNWLFVRSFSVVIDTFVHVSAKRWVVLYQSMLETVSSSAINLFLVFFLPVEFTNFCSSFLIHLWVALISSGASLAQHSSLHSLPNAIYYFGTNFIICKYFLFYSIWNWFFSIYFLNVKKVLKTTLEVICPIFSFQENYISIFFFSVVKY